MPAADDPTGPTGPAGSTEAPGAAERARADRARAAARRALFGDEALTTADERDDTDRARGQHGADDDRRYLDERPPHHDRT